MVSSCASGAPYRSEIDAAETARREKDGERERAHFEKAAQVAPNEDDKSEALYRLAHSLLRDGKLQAAVDAFERLGTTYPESSRAARAWLDAGRTHEKLKYPDRATHAYQQVVHRYPRSGGAITAAKRLAALSSSPEPKTWERLVAENTEPSLKPALLYHWGLSLEDAAPVSAIALYETAASLQPIPQGSYSDDALFRAAELRRSLGDSNGALATLVLLTEQDTSTAIVGSYTREAYVKALFLSAVILREDLRNYVAAHAAFVAVSTRYPSSRLVDDALWEAAITTKKAGDSPCEDAARLRRLRPQSRYLRCESWLCPGSNVAETPSGNCASWAQLHSKD